MIPVSLILTQEGESCRDDADVLLAAALGLPHWIGNPLSTFLTWFLGVFIGQWMLGYKGSYDEYYHESSQ